jgi:pyridoxamine 5'-phosphate oxidase
MIFKDLASMRSEYDKFELNENMLLDNPLDMFALWFEKVVSNFPDDANSMILSTANKLGKPSARVVLLKGIEDNAFIFYTNYLSQKAKDIEENPQVSLLFFWQAFHRQVRIEGTIEKVSRKTSEQYFNTRPLESRIGAIASNQSEKISKEALEKKIYSISQKKNQKLFALNIGEALL